MKYALWITLVSSLTLSLQARTQEIHLTIEGMVCAFCAQGLDALARSQDAVESTTVDMDNRLLVLHLAESKSMGDDEVIAYVRDAGYDLDSFFRSEHSSMEVVERVRDVTGVELPSAITSAVLHEFTDANGQARMLARLTVSNRNSRAWERALQPSDSAMVLPAQSGDPHPWLPTDLEDYRNFRMGDVLVSMEPSGSVLFLQPG